MNKKEFYREIRSNLKDFRSEEVERIVEYYAEIIDEKIEEGVTEEEAIKSLGDLKSNLNVIKADLVIERSEEKKSHGFRNSLIILGICSSPILIPIGISFFIVLFSLVFVLFVLLFSFAIAAISVLIGTCGLLIQLIVEGNSIGLILMLLGGGLVGVSIFSLLSYGVFKFSKFSLNFLNKLFSNIIKRRSKKVGVNYV